MPPKVVKAYDILSGEPRWLTPANDWSGDAKQAELLQDPQLARLRLFEAESQPHLVTGAQLAEPA